MFTDPISIGEGEDEVDLALTSVFDNVSHYASADGVYEISISHTPFGDDAVRHEINLVKNELKTEGDIFSDGPDSLANGVTFAYVTNSLRYESAVIIPELLSLLEGLVTESFRNRLIAGEI